jgi:hypothetical protein
MKLLVLLDVGNFLSTLEVNKIVNKNSFSWSLLVG